MPGSRAITINIKDDPTSLQARDAKPKAEFRIARLKL